jgi:uncharacterized SAM-binding protein YcdF (DUF218 family)
LLNAVADALLPPASLAAAAFLLFLAGPRWHRLGLAVLAAFLALGTGLVAAALMASLTFSDAPPGPEPAAIVILSADGIVLPKPLTLQPGPLTMERMRAGAELHRRTGLPILVSGGSFLGDPTPLAAMMASSLKEDFGIDVRWQEDQSADTWQNAQFSASVLRAAGISRVYLVTSVWHMRRALFAFRHFGVDAVPAPVQPAARGWSWNLLTLRPSFWQASYFALHEWLGLAYYALRQ